MTKSQFISLLGISNIALLLDAVSNGFSDYFDNYAPVSDVHTSRTRASTIHDHMVDRAKLGLLQDSNFRQFSAKGRSLFEFDGKVLINFKKLDEQLKPSNYPTQTAMKFITQEELVGIPSELPRITLGYVPKTDFTDIMGVYAVKYDTAGEPEWEVDLISLLDPPADTDKEDLYGT